MRALSGPGREFGPRTRLRGEYVTHLATLAKERATLRAERASLLTLLESTHALHWSATYPHRASEHSREPRAAAEIRR